MSQTRPSCPQAEDEQSLRLGHRGQLLLVNSPRLTRCPRLTAFPAGNGVVALVSAFFRMNWATRQTRD
jgi:hypothetical protein